VFFFYFLANPAKFRIIKHYFANNKQ